MLFVVKYVKVPSENVVEVMENSLNFIHNFQYEPCIGSVPSSVAATTVSTQFTAQLNIKYMKY